MKDIDPIRLLVAILISREAGSICRCGMPATRLVNEYEPWCEECAKKQEGPAEDMSVAPVIRKLLNGGA